jgi:alpha-beta hydrolase superfamily lysophospholipase
MMLSRMVIVSSAFALFAVISGCTTSGPAVSADSQWRSFRAPDGAEVHYRYWAGPASPRAAVQIVHGAAEHSGRYDRFAKALVSQGYAVYATDHRGHGRTRVRSGQLGDSGPDAWNRFVQDEQQLSQIIRQANSGAKLVLFGHSLGSFIAQDYITRRPELINAVVMSGTSYGPPPPQELLTALDAATKAAPLGPSEFWASLFKDFNKPFTGQPGFEWLSRDAAEVKKYQADSQAGFAFSNELVRDIFKAFVPLRDPAAEARIPKSMPVLVIQGSLDPVGGNLKGTQALLDRYKALGITRVSNKFYEGARHEVLNETNRDEVTRDVLDWLKTSI